MLAIFPRWFATTKENLHKEKSAKKEPPPPPPRGEGSFLAVFGFLGKPTGNNSNIYAYHLMCQGLVAGLPSDCPGLTWRCSWWWQRKEFGFWSNHFPAWSSGWIVFNKCAVPPKSLEFNYSTYNPQNSWYGTFVRVSMLLQPLYWQNILKDGIHIHFGSLNSSGTVGQGFRTWNQSNTSSPLTQTVMLYTPSSAYPKVFKQSFWMRGWGSSTAKRTTLWANSSAVRFFSTTKKSQGEEIF